MTGAAGMMTVVAAMGLTIGDAVTMGGAITVDFSSAKSGALSAAFLCL
jgi:hypothetical protein